MGKVVGLEDLLRQRQSLIEARSSEVEVVSLPSSRSISPTKTPVRLNERCGPLNHGVQCSWVYAAPSINSALSQAWAHQGSSGLLPR